MEMYSELIITYSVEILSTLLICISSILIYTVLKLKSTKNELANINIENSLMEFSDWLIKSKRLKTRTDLKEVIRLYNIYQDSIKPKDSIEISYLTTDAWSNGNPGSGGWRITNQDGITILESKTYPSITNNLAEFLGLVNAMKFRNTHNLKNFIYIDNTIAKSWVISGGIKTKFDFSTNPELEQEINEALEYLDNLHKIPYSDLEKALFTDKFPYIKNWNTGFNGVIPANYGVE